VVDTESAELLARERERFKIQADALEEANEEIAILKGKIAALESKNEDG